MKKRREGGKEPKIYLEGDKHQPHIYRKRKVRWTKILKWLGLILVVLLLVFIVWGYVWTKTKESQMRQPGVQDALSKPKEGRPETTLIIGVDRGSVGSEKGPGRSDILMMVSVDDATKKAAVISIPRDTRVQIPGQKGYNKINAAHSYGGPKLTLETAAQFTGLDMNHFVEIDFEGFKQIVNAIGGVPMHIDVPIHDKYAGDVPAGDVVLNGDQALALVRARYDVKAVPEGDIDRVKNQRIFLQAMLSAVSHQRNPFKLMKLIDAASKNIKTDLTFMQMLSLGRKLQGAKGSNLEMTTVPGEPKLVSGTWYYIADMNKFKELIKTFETKTEVKTEEELSKDRSSKEGIKVGVLNGARVAGLAASVANELTQKGYGDVRTANAPSHYKKTTIYYADGDSSKAGTVAADLSGTREPVLQRDDEMTAEYGVQVLVILGSDYSRT